MKDPTLVYKLTAVVAVGWAMYSCSSPAESQSTASLAQEIADLRTEIVALRSDVGGCTTDGFLGNDSAHPCAAGVLPDGAAVTATFCTDQGRGVELSTGLELGIAYELEGGAGWPNAVWGKGTAKATVPAILPTPPFILPTTIGGNAAAHIGKGFEICVDLPISPDADQVAQIQDLVRGVNVDSGIQAKYRRRTNRLLNYAAVRTPIAGVSLLAGTQSKTGFVTSQAIEESDDAFDLAEDAFDRFMTNGFQANPRAGGILSDPIFTDLATSMDLPEQVTSIINNPQQMLSGFQSISLANSCTNLGIDATVRGQYPQVNSLCNSIAALPGDGLKSVSQALTTLQNAVTTIQTRVQTLTNRVCSLPLVSGC